MFRIFGNVSVTFINNCIEHVWCMDFFLPPSPSLWGYTRGFGSMMLWNIRAVQIQSLCGVGTVGGGYCPFQVFLICKLQRGSKFWWDCFKHISKPIRVTNNVMFNFGNNLTMNFQLKNNVLYLQAISILLRIQSECIFSLLNWKEPNLDDLPGDKDERWHWNVNRRYWISCSW